MGILVNLCDFCYNIVTFGLPKNVQVWCCFLIGAKGVKIVTFGKKMWILFFWQEKNTQIVLGWVLLVNSSRGRRRFNKIAQKVNIVNIGHNCEFWLEIVNFVFAFGRKNYPKIVRVGVAC